MNFQVKHGVTRVVILVWKWAFKFPTYRSWKNFLNGLLSNMQETSFSKLTSWEGLCPVLWHDSLGFLVIMPRVEPLTTEEFMEAEDMVKGWAPGFVEIKPCSFGKLHGKIVAVDYGSIT